MTVTIQTSSNSISKAIAFIAVTVGLAVLLQLYDNQSLAEMSSMSPDAFVQSERHIHQQGMVIHILTVLLMGAFYLVSIELLAYGLRKIMPKNAKSISN